METKKFSDLIDQKVQIPPYQRDYAHGRLTPQAEEIRQTLNEKFAEVLSSPDKNMSFDFIYGYEEGDHFVPVDGQQRLTTLFLLHLYLSKRSGDFEPRLANFSYATRQLTREFCEKITARETVLWTDEISPLKYIPDQSWFFSKWGADPSIMGMIRVLDLIYGRFSGLNSKTCWARLKSGSAITFGIPDQSKIGPSEKTYLKMNSRYLSLDDFENFKAHFEKYLSGKARSGIRIDHRADCQDWEKMAFHKKVIWKFDKDWSNYFWKKYEVAFSGRFMAVIARAFACFAVLNGDEENRGFFEDLAAGKKNFVSFAPFEKTLRYNEDKLLGLLFSFLDNISDPGIAMETLVDPPWDEPDFEFLSPCNDKYRVVFGGALLFGKIEDTTDFSEWMRVVWNIAANTPDLKAFPLFEKLAESKQNLLAHMAGKYDPEKRWSPDPRQKEPTLLECQFNHECLKAEILTEHPERRQKILEMEGKPFFHGDISVQLLHSSDPEVWKARDKKLGEYPLNECGFLKNLLLHLKDYAQLEYCFMQGETPFIFNADNYHRLARLESIQEVIAEMLDGNAAPGSLAWPYHEPTVKRIYRQLAEKDTLEVFMRKGLKGCRLWWNNDWLYLHQRFDRSGYFLLNSPMYEILDDLLSKGEITMDEDQKWDGVFHYDQVAFTYQGVKMVCNPASIWKDGMPDSREDITWENPDCGFSDGAEKKFLDCCDRVCNKSQQNAAATVNK